MKPGDTVLLNGTPWRLIRLLGKGKSGYSWLVEHHNQQAVYKQIHHEPVSYYQFGDKFSVEIRAYHHLSDLQVKLPALLDYNEQEEWLIKTYLSGLTVAEQVAAGILDETIWPLIFGLSHRLKQKGINLDWFPANFVQSGGDLYYVDYEWNVYEPEWDFPNWGLFYWLNQTGMKQFLETGDHTVINLSGTGKPIRDGLESTVSRLVGKWCGS